MRLLRAAAAEFELQQSGRDAETESIEGLQHHTPTSQGGWEPACVCIVQMVRAMMFSYIKKILYKLNCVNTAGKLD